MWLARAIIIPYLLLAVVYAAYIDMAKIEKRAIAYITVVTTVDAPATTSPTTEALIQQAVTTSTNDLITLATSQTAAVQDIATGNTANVVVATQSTANPNTIGSDSTTSSSSSNSSFGGISSWLTSLFGLDSDSSSDSGSATSTSIISANGVGTTQSTANTDTSGLDSTTTSSSSSSSSGGIVSWLANLFGLGGDSSSDSGSTTSTSVTSVLSTNSAVSSNTATSLDSFSKASSTSLISSESSTSSSSSDSGSGAAVYAEKSKGITYSPYTKSNSCKSSSQVASDIEKLQDYSLIRLYSVDCSGIENVLSAMTSSQKLFLGVWNIDSTSVQNDLQTMKEAVETSSRGWSAVHTISIGNEQVNSGTGTVAQVSAGVEAARNWLKSNAADYDGYIVTVDTYNQVIANPDMCDISDYIAVNCHPYFTGTIQPSETGPWLQDQINSVSSACGGSKSVLITETGWPTQGDSIGSCVPSESNQVEAFKSLVSSVGSQIISFTMYNDYWKDPGPYSVEQHWGIYGDPSA